MRSITLFIIFILIQDIGHAQADYIKYNYYTSQMMYHRFANPDSAIFYFEKSLSYCERPLNDYLLYAAGLYADADNYKKTEYIYRQLQPMGYGFDDVFTSQGIELSEKSEKKLKTERVPLSDLDFDFIFIFSEYQGAEQFVRKRLFRDKECMEKYLSEIDSLNHARLKEYIDENGFPGETRIGKYKYIPLMLITHFITNESTKENWYGYYRPILIKQAEVGEVSYSFIAGLDDRFHECYDAYQLYGMIYMAEEPTYRMTNEERQKAPKNLTCPITDIENLDKRRAEMGMPPFYIMAKSQNVKLPKNYSPKK